MSTKITIYADGSCKNNNSTSKETLGGWGCLILYNDKSKEIYGGSKNTTNNIMELQAVIEPLKILSKANKRYEIEIFTDSNYVCQCVNSWSKNWIKNNWKTANKEPVKNKELIVELLELCKFHDITFTWVKGHSTNQGNIRADELANLGVYSIR